MGGSIDMIGESLKLAYGENSDYIKDKKIAAVERLLKALVGLMVSLLPVCSVKMITYNQPDGCINEFDTIFAK
ncbi:hypothetical protein Sjap_026132 [Stephania japonica]|uniref:Uncharacterized protein n=1 Tax=Stephania japonica TaxID=461633 RepID=A0AAP0E312_9MAGN